MRLQDMGDADFAEKITSSKQNEDILWELDSNTIHELSIVTEDDVTAFEDFQVRESDNLLWLGYFIGKCTSLTNLDIKNFPGDADRINEFLRGLNCNRSIQILTIENDRGVEMLEKLSTFFHNNENIYSLDLENFDIGYESAGKLASTLCDAPLKHLGLCGNVLSNEGFETIVTAASGVHSQIESLRVGWNNVGQVGCTALLRSGSLEQIEGP